MLVLSNTRANSHTSYTLPHTCASQVLHSLHILYDASIAIATSCQVFERLGPSLFDFLRKNGYRPFPLGLVQQFVRQMIRSVKYLHELRLVRELVRVQGRV